MKYSLSFIGDCIAARVTHLMHHCDLHIPVVFRSFREKRRLLVDKIKDIIDSKSIIEISEHHTNSETLSRWLLDELKCEQTIMKDANGKRFLVLVR